MVDIVVLDPMQMATVLKRYVDILTKKEAHLLEQEGFFNREEHFELFLKEVRTEFDSHPKIRACFAHKAGATNCINFLLGQGAHTRDPLKETRRYELSFMSTVLLRTSSVSGVLAEEPALLSKLLGFVEQRPQLDEAIVHYWSKVFRHLLSLRVCDRRLLLTVPHLVQHVADDSVQGLLSEILGSLKGAVSLLPCLQGVNPLAPLVDTLFESERGARNACEVLCAVCLAVCESGDKGAHALVWRALAPALPRFLRAVFAPRHGNGGHCEARVEHCLSFLVELLMLHTRVGADANSPEGGAVRLLLPHLGALKEMMRSSQTFVQLKAAELLTVALVLVEEGDSDPLAVAIVQAGVLPLSVSLFFEPDVNGGGRQDFLRHVLLRVFCEALACDNAPVHRELLLQGGGALAKTIVRSAKRPFAYGSVTHTQMAMRLLNDACARLPAVRLICAETPGWRTVLQAVVGQAGASLKSPEPECVQRDSEGARSASSTARRRSPPTSSASSAAILGSRLGWTTRRSSRRARRSRSARARHRRCTRPPRTLRGSTRCTSGPPRRCCTPTAPTSSRTTTTTCSWLRTRLSNRPPCPTTTHQSPSS
ncbi:hypothetical protein T492DRAFT_51157 [Pavlovales sp. CCMP2436]|nr:hypothetical protein T492DRAFT_307346 [Pavlovales sp. CCMP2436]KAJ1631608.1 hypothetical protein T492DRAFT_51157 [Pavlovales sp. CCMP2436]